MVLGGVGSANKAKPDGCSLKVLGPEGDATYDMFDVAELSQYGAVLTGPYLLEVGEELRVAVVLAGSGKGKNGKAEVKVELEARVTESRPDGDLGRLRLRFADTKKLAEHLG